MLRWSVLQSTVTDRMDEREATQPSRRLVSLDVLRGLAVAAMLLVNNPGSWEFVYPPLLHAEWHGCTPTDIIFPCFLFVVGVSLAFSLAKCDRPPYAKILRRAVLLFLLGLLLNASSLLMAWAFQGTAPEWEKLRILGVLQRISLAYLLASPVVLHLKPRGQAIASVAILFGYWFALALGGDLSPEGNFAATVDRALLGADRLYLGGPYDPEGLFSTLPAIVTVLAGRATGAWLRDCPRRSETSLQLAIAGLAALVVGRFWHFAFPLNKPLWTSSYVIFTAGWSLVLLAACFEAIEVRQWRRLGMPFAAAGLNAISIFVASGIVARALYKTSVGSGDSALSTYAWLYENGFRSWAGDVNGSLAFAIATVLFWCAIAWGLYRKKWFLKI